MPMFPLTTTLNRIKTCDPCDDGWQAGLKAASKTEPDDEPISYEAILNAVGIDNALWCCRAETQYESLWRRYAVWCARQVQHLMADQRSITALDVAERHANGEATDSELASAADAAWDTAMDAAMDAVKASARTSARASARDAVKASARASARASAWDAISDTAWASAKASAWSAAWASAWTSARDAQSAAFCQLVTTGTLPNSTGDNS